jgi:mannose-1-phosphate guanylyltransferase/mannose-6-phosphate isomerase
MKTVILAGGKGTRLWPLSRELMPKQFIRLFDSESLFQKTLKRALLLSKPDEILIVANKEYRFRVQDDLTEIRAEVPEENILLEPEGKNTLPAIFWAVMEIEKRFEGGTVAVLPSDHLVDADNRYLKAFKNALKLAEKYLVTFGIKPDRPHTGYGYIKPGKKVQSGFEVEEFREKPDLNTATKYVEKGYLWNSGMFLFNTGVFLSEAKKLAPEVVRAFEEDNIEKVYQKVPGVSVDYAIMEKTKRAAVVPLEVRWSDVGSFDALYDVMEKDNYGNAVRISNLNAEFISVDSSNNLLITQRLTAAIGVEDLVIVDTDDALLIARKGETQKVRNVFSMLKEKADERAIVHRTAYRPWGSYTVLEEGEGYRIKRLTVQPGKRLSLQRHYHRSEHWVVISGTARVVVDEREVLLRQGESTFIPAGVLHRLENPGKIPLEVIEVQIGQYLGEDDIERIEDDFGR